MDRFVRIFSPLTEEKDSHMAISDNVHCDSICAFNTSIKIFKIHVSEK